MLPMKSTRARTVDVADESTVGYYEYGDSAGIPVIAFHGVPASGAGFAWTDEPAAVRGLRVIAPDRPGVGLSTRRPNGWTVADYAASFRQFTDALGIDKFGVWGYSGGGPYALACAATFPAQTAGVVIAAGMGQIGVWASADDFEKTDRQMLDLALRRPWLARRIMAATAFAAKVAPRIAVRSFEGELTSSDREVIESFDTPAAAMEMFTSAFVSGPHGVVDDYAAIARSWGCDVAGIPVRVDVMHGSEDTMVPIAHAQALTALLPDARLTVWPGEGHLATISHVGEVLDRFLASD